MTLSHKDLVFIAEDWLLKRCGFAFRELSTMSYETPDAIGFLHNTTILIECKATKTDFLSDGGKMFRKKPQMGVGRFRYYMCPKELIHPNDLPDQWGLIYVNSNGKTRKVVGPKGNVWSGRIARPYYFKEVNEANEKALMYSALRRLYLQGVMPLIYQKYRDNHHKRRRTLYYDSE